MVTVTTEVFLETGFVNPILCSHWTSEPNKEKFPPVLEVKGRSLPPLFGQLELSLLNLVKAKGCRFAVPGNIAFPPVRG